MTEILHNENNYTGFLHTLGRVFKTQVKDDALNIPEEFGNGYIWAYNLPDGISILICNTQFKDDVLLKYQPSSNHQYFILQFNESIDDSGASKKENTQHTYNMQQSMILLTSSQMAADFFIPAHAKIVCIKIIFEKNYLLNFMGNDIVDEFFSNYFSMQLKNGKTEPIDSDYRNIMNELVKEKIEHPLKTNFIQNRILMLIEKLVVKFMGKLETNKHAFKLKDDEISRLVKVESILVKDYSGAPPTISNLSRTAAMSPTKLKKDFKALYGLPVYEYYQKNRMMRAKQLLLEGRYAIKEVGMMVGYTNLGHFAASFKKEFGILPSEMNTTNYLSHFIPAESTA